MTVFSSTGQFLVCRLSPGDDFKLSLQSISKITNSPAISVVSCVGSLSQVALRFANQATSKLLTDKFEIVALSGTISPEGVHLHLAISDGQGALIGGHLGEGSLVYTTAEIVLVELPQLSFARQHDPATGFRELVICNR